MAVTLKHNEKIRVEETLSTGVSSDNSDNMIVHDSMSSNRILNSGTTPPVTQVAQFAQGLTAGAKTIDLTALVGTNGAAVNGTGLKVQLFKVTNRVGNAAITLTDGASNGYELAGDAWKVILLAGQSFTFYGNDATPDVAVGAKTIDCTGTGTQTFDVIVVMG